jgi:folate-binding protein YgfZ
MIPIIHKESSEKFIPQMLNLDILNAVSFSKGCYTGQEVVARVQHRGKIKQRMFKIKTESKSLVSAGSEIHHGTKKVGTVGYLRS